MIKSTKFYSMKYIHLCILLNAICLQSVTSQAWHKPVPHVPQPCLTGGISFTNQDQIDQFSSLYPNCNEIDGAVLIMESSPGEITSLDGLSQVKHINGDLRIAHNYELSTLSGLHHLKSVDGSILIFENDALSSITDLHGIDIINGTLSIGKNEVLESIEGIENIYYGMTDLRIFANPLLSICAIGNICNYLSNGGNHTISGNAYGCASTAELTSFCITSNPCTKTFINLSVNPIFDGTYQAINEIYSTGSIPKDGEVNFKAGNCVIISGGFSVGQNASFSAEIENCGL